MVDSGQSFRGGSVKRIVAVATHHHAQPGHNLSPGDGHAGKRKNCLILG